LIFRHENPDLEEWLVSAQGYTPVGDRWREKPKEKSEEAEEEEEVEEVPEKKRKLTWLEQLEEQGLLEEWLEKYK